jgi:hypothetical protein
VTHHKTHHKHHKKRRKKIKIFHPKKPWIIAAMIALTIGMAVGEHHLEKQVSPMMATKLSQNFQTSAFNPITTSKVGFMRAFYRVSFLSADSDNPLEEEITPIKEGVKRVCFWEDPDEEVIYSGETVEVKITEDIQVGDEFRAEVYVENTGNVTWYGTGSGCLDKTMVYLGTMKEEDRASEFFEVGASSGWIGDNRIKMMEDAVQPGETATFVFTGTAPDTETIYREWFGLVAEHITWFDDFEVAVDIEVGEVSEEEKDIVQFMKSISGNTASLDLEDRWFDINLSNQQLSLMAGDVPVYQMTISSGASSTPTPTGTWHVLNKQELRVGGAWPHYRMPYWQGFTVWGHGFHALPYLESDGGVFWSEALTHIGIPVSHGCIRMLPDDSVTVYEFSEVGTEIYIHH